MRRWSTTCGPSSSTKVSRSGTWSMWVPGAPAEVAEEIDRRLRAGEFRLEGRPDPGATPGG